MSSTENDQTFTATEDVIVPGAHETFTATEPASSRKGLALLGATVALTLAAGGVFVATRTTTTQDVPSVGNSVTTVTAPAPHTGTPGAPVVASPATAAVNTRPLSATDPIVTGFGGQANVDKAIAAASRFANLAVADCGRFVAPDADPSLGWTEENTTVAQTAADLQAHPYAVLANVGHAYKVTSKACAPNGAVFGTDGGKVTPTLSTSREGLPMLVLTGPLSADIHTADAGVVRISTTDFSVGFVIGPKGDALLAAANAGLADNDHDGNADGYTAAPVKAGE